MHNQSTFLNVVQPETISHHAGGNHDDGRKHRQYHCWYHHRALWHAWQGGGTILKQRVYEICSYIIYTYIFVYLRNTCKVFHDLADQVAMQRVKSVVSWRLNGVISKPKLFLCLHVLGRFDKLPHRLVPFFASKSRCQPCDPNTFPWPCDLCVATGDNTEKYPSTCWSHQIEVNQ